MRRDDTFRAERTFRGRIRGDIEAPERFDWDVKARGTTGPVDQHRGPGNVAARGSHRVDGLVHRAARRHDVVDHDATLPASKREPTPELAAGAALAALGIDRPHAELPRDLVREDDSSGGRAGDRLDIERSCPRGECGTEALRLDRMLKYLELLEIQRRVPAGREDEVPLTERARFAEDTLNVRRGDGHHDYSARR